MDRFTAALVAAVLVLVAAGVVVAAASRGRDLPPDLSTPAGVVVAYVQAEERGDPETAWSLLASSVQARAAHDQFVLRASRPRGPHAFLSTEDEHIDGDTASLVLVHTYPASGGILSGGSGSSAERATVRLSREPAGWRITLPPDRWVLVN